MVREASSDPGIVSISSLPHPYSDDAGRGFIRRQHRRAAIGDGFSFVIAGDAVDAPEAIGSIGLWLHEIDNGRASIGYWLVARSRGGGLAAHALRALVAFAFGELLIPRLHVFVEPSNIASARTAEAAGFWREATLRGWERIDGEQRDADCYALLRTEWSPPRPA
jgi:RimJ/RimL family protein N-acetyltransferase